MRKTYGYLRAVLLALSTAAAWPAATALAAEDGGTWGLIIENDEVVNTDRHYTHGTRGAWISAAGEVPSWLDGVGDALPLLADEGARRYGIAIGQNIYTPTNIQARRLIEDDRPYAGWLYGGLILTSDTGSQLDTLELDLGIIGPASLAEQVQRGVHELSEAQIPNGWGNQLDNEPGLALFYTRQWRNIVPIGGTGLQLDISPHTGFSLGNVFTYGAAGGMIRLGQHLQSSYGAPVIRPGMTGSTFFDRHDGLGWYVFAGVEGRIVLRNIFLDGNTFGDSHSVDKEAAVGDLQIGAAVTYGPVRLSGTYVVRSREFQNQDEPDRLGSLNLSVKF